VKLQPSYANVAATIALFLALGGPAAAGARTLITGNDVQDHSLTGLDIANHSLTGTDIKAGSLGSGAFSDAALANLRGATGPEGAEGAAGKAGAPGPAGPQGLPGQGIATTARSSRGPRSLASRSCPTARSRCSTIRRRSAGTPFCPRASSNGPDDPLAIASRQATRRSRRAR
jgi:hypothetical protein